VVRCVKCHRTYRDIHGDDAQTRLSRLLRAGEHHAAGVSVVRGEEVCEELVLKDVGKVRERSGGDVRGAVTDLLR